MRWRRPTRRRLLFRVLHGWFAALLLLACSVQANPLDNGAVATAHPGQRSRPPDPEAGGNAFDATVAVSAALAVVEPYGSGSAVVASFCCARPPNRPVTYFSTPASGARAAGHVSARRAVPARTVAERPAGGGDSRHASGTGRARRTTWSPATRGDPGAGHRPGPRRLRGGCGVPPARQLAPGLRDDPESARLFLDEAIFRPKVICCASRNWRKPWSDSPATAVTASIAANWHRSWSRAYVRPAASGRWRTWPTTAPWSASPCVSPWPMAAS